MRSKRATGNRPQAVRLNMRKVDTVHCASRMFIAFTFVALPRLNRVSCRWERGSSKIKETADEVVSEGQVEV